MKKTLKELRVNATATRKAYDAAEKVSDKAYDAYVGALSALTVAKERVTALTAAMKRTKETYHARDKDAGTAYAVYQRVVNTLAVAQQHEDGV